MPKCQEGWLANYFWPGVDAESGWVSVGVVLSLPDHWCEGVELIRFDQALGFFLTVDCFLGTREGLLLLAFSACALAADFDLGWVGVFMGLAFVWTDYS